LLWVLMGSYQLKWKNFIVIEGYAQKLLMLKLDSLWEHDGQRTATIVIATMVVGKYYILKINQHVFNKHLHVVKGEIVCCSLLYNR
jgi:hypothetical protein